MKRSLQLVALAASAVWMAACGAPAGNNAANSGNANATNTNTNTAKPVAAAPTKDALLDMDKKANEAYLKGDAKFFEGFLSDKFVMYDDSTGKVTDKATVVKMIGDVKCESKSLSLDEGNMQVIDADTAVIVYKATFDGTCNGPDGKPMKIPSPVRAASVYVRNGDKWQGAFHGENLIIDPKNPPKAAPPPPSKKDTAKKDDKAAANSNSAAPAKPAADPNTATIVAIEKSGWDAWKARDGKKLEELTAKEVGFVDMLGLYTPTKAETIKSWIDSKCDIKSVGVENGAVTMLSPTVAILTFRGTAEGTCEGQKLKPANGTSVYVKEGDTWKMTFGVESPVM